MLTGFNTNIKYKGTVFHVQTEDSGLRNPVITTLLYRGGVILASKKTSYKELIPEDTRSISTLLREKIKQLMTEQHRSMISDLFAGRFDDIITGQKPAFQEIRSISLAEDPGSGQSVKTRDSVDGNIGLAKESGKSMRSLDDILLEHIIKKKKNT